MNREFSRRGIDSFVGSAGGKLVNCIENDGGKHVNLSLSSKNILSFSENYSLKESIKGFKT